MRAPRDFEELKSQIARRYGDLSGRLQQIAEFALHHPNDMALGTVAAIAERAGVQPSSIVRFANSFGFDGFSEMQQLFRLRLLAGAASYRDRIAALQQTKVDGGASAMRPSSAKSIVCVSQPIMPTIGRRTPATSPGTGSSPRAARANGSKSTPLGTQ